MEIQNDGVEDIKTNTAFERVRDDSGLLAEGGKIYAELSGSPEKLGQKLEDLGVELNEHIMTLMMEESKETEVRQHEIRILFNGVMDAAGEDNNPKITVDVKDMLEGLFGLDEDSSD